MKTSWIVNFIFLANCHNCQFQWDIHYHSLSYLVVLLFHINYVPIFICQHFPTNVLKLVLHYNRNRGLLYSNEPAFLMTLLSGAKFCTRSLEIHFWSIRISHNTSKDEETPLNNHYLHFIDLMPNGTNKQNHICHMPLCLPHQSKLSRR